LNANTIEGIGFFAVEVGAIKIGDSQIAPDFKAVVQPDDWGKTVRAATTGETTPKEKLYWEFWEEYRQRVLAEYPSWTHSTQSTKSSWFQMSAGISNVNWISAFTGMGVMVHIDFVGDAEENRRRLAALEPVKAQMEAIVGAPLVYDVLETGRRPRSSSSARGEPWRSRTVRSGKCGSIG